MGAPNSFFVARAILEDIPMFTKFYPANQMTKAEAARRFEVWLDNEHEIRDWPIYIEEKPANECPISIQEAA